MQTPPDLRRFDADPKSSGVRRRQAIAVAAIVFTGTLLLSLARWLLPRPVGAADNGDGWRLLCRLGGNEPGRISENWVRMAYRPSPDCYSGYASSQEWVARAAQWIGHQLGSSAALNLYVLGALSCLFIAVAVTTVAIGLPLGLGGRFAAAALVWLVLADSAFFGWFVSVLSEPAAFLGVAVTVGGLLWLQRQDGWRYPGAVFALAGAVLAVNAKAQTLLLLPALAIALLLARKTGSGVMARWALPVLVLAATAGATAAIQGSGDPAGVEYRKINAYHVIFHNIVDGRHDAAADLADLGLPASFARYHSTNWWGSNPAPASTDPLWPQYRDRVSMRNVAHWYLEHPWRTVEILHAGAVDMLTARPDNIGSFAASSGQPAQAKEYRVAVLSGLIALVAPLGLFFLLPLWLVTAWAAVWAYRRCRPVAVVTVFLLGSAVGQFAIAALAEGIEGVKHQVIALFCTLLAVVMASSPVLVRAVPRATM